MRLKDKITHRRIFVYLLTLGFATSLAISCATTERARPTTSATQFEKAKRRYEARSYLEAADQFKVLLAQFPGSKYAEPATFFLGKCYFESKEYPLAEVEFERITRDFPRGSYAEEAAFMLGMCAYKERRPAPYDQTSTEKAIALLQAYIGAYPEGTFAARAQQKLRECQSILGQKLYLGGQLYLKLGDFPAARTCFEEVLDKYADFSWAEWALLGIAESYERERNWGKALETYEDLVKRDKDAEVSSVAKDRLKKIGAKGKQTREKG
jgi:outer membrane protein assembly factor BamD